MASFGERIKREREMRGVSLEEIAESTKIGKRNLLALETEEFNKLPGGIFNKGFVRAYAKYLGLDEDQAVTDFLAAENAASTGIRLAVDPVPATADAPGTNGDAARKTRKERSRELEAIAARRESDKRNNPPLNPTNTGNRVWVVLAVVCLLGALVGWWKYSHPVREAVVSQSKPVVVAPVVATPAPALPSAAENSAPVPAAEGDGLAHLKVRAIQDSWILVKADGKVILDGTLDAATEKTFSAKELIFKTGNAGGVEVTYNGKTEAPFGKDKQVKEIKIKAEKKPVS